MFFKKSQWASSMVLVSILVSWAWGAPVEKDAAIQACTTHLRGNAASVAAERLLVGGPPVETPGFSIEGVSVLTAEDSVNVLAYVVDLQPKGYVVISPDSDIAPIVAYSFDNPFPLEDANHPLLRMVTWDMESRIRAIPILPEEVKIGNNAIWQDYLDGDDAFIARLAASETWGPWVSTQWEQNGPYNKYCPCIASWPVVGGCMTRGVVGCVATAMAQIINYWNYPHSVEFNDADRYVTDGLKIRIDQDAETRDFPTFAELNEMLEHIDYAGDEDEIASLCFACGVSVHMDYNDSPWWIFHDPSSGAYTSATAEAYRRKFKYASASVKWSSNADFYDVLLKNMKEGQPAQLSIYKQKQPGDPYEEGHSIIADGYKDTGEYHLNWGWGGWPFGNDGWYFLPEGMPSGYNVVNGGVLDIQPSPIGQGIEWLRERQSGNGSWSDDPALTSFAVLTMRNWGYDETDTVVAKGLGYILSKINGDGSVYTVPGRYTYYTSIAILPLATTHNPAYHDEIANMRNWLIGSQWDESSFYGNVGTDNSYYGGFGYGNSTRPDLSNTQWALMGLKAADRELGLDAGNAYDKCANYFLARCRNGDGGSTYTPGYSGSIHTMTAASVWSYTLCGRGSGPEALGGIQWLTDHYSLTNNDGWGWWSEYYYKVTLAKALVMTNKTILGAHDWFSELSDKLMEEQSTEGSWPDTGMMGSEMSTCWAIMALQTRTMPPTGDFAMWVTLQSHGDLHVRDPDGRHVGVNYETNSIEENIPGARFRIFDPNGQEVPYDGSTPDEGMLQVVGVPVIPGSYQVMIVGTSDGPYHLTINGVQDANIVTTDSFEGQITAGKKLATNVVVAWMEGPTLIIPRIDVLPELDVLPEQLQLLVKPNTIAGATFKVKEVGGEKTLHGVSMYCTDLTAPGAHIDGSDVTFDPASFDVAPGGERVVNASIPIPSGLIGACSGSIVVESIDGGTRSIAITVIPGNILQLDTGTGSEPLYIKPHEVALLDMDALELYQYVFGCQAVLNFSSEYFIATPSGAGSPQVAAGGGVWDELIYRMWTIEGDLDVAVGVDLNVCLGTIDDGTVAKFGLTSNGTEGITKMVFRPDTPIGQPCHGTSSTFFADANAMPVYPNKIDSQDIIIDGTPPCIDIVRIVQNGVDVSSCAATVVQGEVHIYVDAGDALAGLVGIPVVTTSCGIPVEFIDDDPCDVGCGRWYHYKMVIEACSPNGDCDIQACAEDKAGNSACDGPVRICINKNQISGLVELEGLKPPAGGRTRTVTFVATGPGARKVWNIPVHFPESSSKGQYVLKEVPDGVTCLSAKTAWNLRRTKTGLSLDACGQLTVNFVCLENTGLLAGDARWGALVDDNKVNILDYAVLKRCWCDACDSADWDGDGVISLKDYALLRNNFFKVGDPECN